MNNRRVSTPPTNVGAPMTPQRLLFLLSFFLVLGCENAVPPSKEMPDADLPERVVSVLDAGVERSTESQKEQAPDASVVEVTANETTEPEPSFDAGEEAVGSLPDDMPEQADPEKQPETQPDPKNPTNPNVAQSGFRTLHWNIAGGKENACQTAGITRAVMRFVRDFSNPVDFVNLNEVCEPQFNAIRDELRKHWNKKNSDTFAVFHALNQRKVGVAIFSRFNLRNITKDKLGQDQYGDRYLICARQEGRRVRLCGTHLTPADATARKQLLLVMNRVEGFWNNNKDTVILAGDLNLHANDVGLNAVYSAAANTPNNPGNNGSYRELDDDDPNHCKGYGEGTLAGTAAGPCKAGGKIDFIFARQNRIVNNNYNADSLPIPQDCTGACSDHRAVRGYVRIEYRTD